MDLRPEAIQNAARLLRDSEHRIRRYISDAGKLALNNILGYVFSFLVSVSDDRKRETRGVSRRLR